jgi:hypothetical protein
MTRIGQLLPSEPSVDVNLVASYSPRFRYDGTLDRRTLVVKMKFESSSDLLQVSAYLTVDGQNKRQPGAKSIKLRGQYTASAEIVAMENGISRLADTCKTTMQSVLSPVVEKADWSDLSRLQEDCSRAWESHLEANSSKEMSGCDAQVYVTEGKASKISRTNSVMAAEEHAENVQLHEGSPVVETGAGLLEVSSGGCQEPSGASELKDQQRPEWRKNVFLALGSNVGDRFKNIEDACEKLDQCPDIRIVQTSPLFETEPMYVEDQDRFLNGVCMVRHSCSARSFEHL